ncbi:unnamed protein product [Ambrosiozyma monospora]|uniref:Unnamed protein product n=1 Tax=Ambrosiozyma monospora TaxID=43982 RepID=A0ACB5TA65_AMBMO|nr:unnamed protein product [Ambrosiozyma monospora]
MADIVKVIVSFVVEAQTITEETIMGIREIVAVPLLYFGLHYMLNKYTFDSFTQTERNLMTILFMTMVFAIRASSSNITLVILQKLVYSFGMGAVFNVPLMEFYVKQQQNSTKYVLAAVCHTIFLVIGVTFTDIQLTPILGEHPFEFLVKFITATDERFTIFKYWIGAFVTVIPAFVLVSSYLPLDVRRKFWHYALFSALAYPLIIDPELVSLALVGLLGIFLFVELQRATKLKPFGEFFASVLKPFQDKRDSSGLIVVSYLFLVLGVGLPIWFNGATGLNESCIGLITLGLGDSSASLIGKRIGKHKWFNGSNKSFEGSAAFLLATGAGLSVMRSLGQNSYSDSTIWLTSLLVSLVEGTTEMNDNVLVPVMGYIILNVLNRY